MQVYDFPFTWKGWEGMMIFIKKNKKSTKYCVIAYNSSLYSSDETINNQLRKSMIEDNDKK